MADRSHRSRRILGVAFDSDGHIRVTRGEEFVLVGGSERTHDRMQEDVDRFRHSLARQGTDLQHATPREMLRALRHLRRP